MAKKNKTKKGRKMIKNFTCYMQGPVGTRSLESIKEYVRDMARADIVGFNKDDSGVVEHCYYGWLNINLFGKKNIVLNQKNIEYYESFYLVQDFGSDDKLNDALHRYRIEDVGIGLYIYRIGSYSYYMAICEAYSPLQPKDE